jgi:hypothetical protein
LPFLKLYELAQMPVKLVLFSGRCEYIGEQVAPDTAIVEDMMRL